MNTSIFTRYLYYKNDVVLSFILCILKKDIEQSLFWGYELYYSGFKEEVFDILISTYENYFEKLNSKKIKSFIENKKIEWKKNINKHSILATIIHNIATRDNNTNNDCSIIDPLSTKKKIIYAVYREKNVEKYKTFDNMDESSIKIPPYRILQLVCKYSIIKNGYEYLIYDFIKPYLNTIPREQLCEYYFYHWEYYAYYTPLWKKRIDKYNGYIDVEKRQVVFNNDELEDLFYKQYGYEPDEQPNEITEKTIGKKE